MSVNLAESPNNTTGTESTVPSVHFVPTRSLQSYGVVHPALCDIFVSCRNKSLFEEQTVVYASAFTNPSFQLVKAGTFWPSERQGIADGLPCGQCQPAVPAGNVLIVPSVIYVHWL
jgi:hypothetical protein